jgi:hypothetical protein
MSAVTDVDRRARIIALCVVTAVFAVLVTALLALL